MIDFIPGNLLGCPELQAIGRRAPVKPVVKCGIIAPHVVISVRVQQLIDGQIASNAYSMPAYQKSHNHNQRDLQNSHMTAIIATCDAHSPEHSSQGVYQQELCARLAGGLTHCEPVTLVSYRIQKYICL